MSKNTDVRSIALDAISISLVCVMTMFIQIPVPGTSGYVHLGDSMILLIAIFLGKKTGAIAGGIGSSLADILSGHAHWALFTLIIKSLMGYAAGYFSNYRKGQNHFLSINTFLSSLIASIIMLFGYFIGGAILKGSIVTSLASVPANSIQSVMGIALFYVIGKVFDRIKLIDFVQNHN